MAVPKQTGGQFVDIQIEPPTPQHTQIGGFKGSKPQKSATRRGPGSTIHSGNIFDHRTFHSKRVSYIYVPNTSTNDPHTTLTLLACAISANLLHDTVQIDTCLLQY